jgi:multidrug resistance efflux pump
LDIKVEVESKSSKKRYISLLIGLVALMVIYWVFSLPAAQSKVESKQLWIEKVQQGSLELTVTGFGQLESKVQRFLTAPYSAVVEEIILRPGAKVTPESIILKMSNPEIDQAVILAQLALNAENARLKQLKLTQTRENLSASNGIAELKLDLGVFRSKLAAETKLAKQGIVTQLNLMTTQAEVNKLAGRLDNSKERLKQLIDIHQQGLQIQAEYISEKSSLLKIAENNFQRLLVRAGIDGVLQALPVELGQSVSTGHQLALVGGTNDLLAIVQIPQRDVQAMLAGMSVSIDTRGGFAQGKVTRIDPVVKDGNVEVEIELIGQLPKNARPSLKVEAKVNLGRLDNALYIKAPVNSSPNSRLKIFKVDAEASSAEVTWLKFGVKNGQYIEIKSGAKYGEQFILSDMNKFSEQTNIQIIP